MIDERNKLKAIEHKLNILSRNGIENVTKQEFISLINSYQDVLSKININKLKYFLPLEIKFNKEFSEVIENENIESFKNEIILIIKSLENILFHFNYKSFIKLKERTGVFDSIIETNEIAIRDFCVNFDKIEINKQKDYIKEKAKTHNLHTNDNQFAILKNRIYQLYLLSVHQQFEQFLREFRSEAILYEVIIENKNFTEKKFIETFLPFFKSNIEKTRLFYKWYREKKNFIINFVEQSDTEIKQIKLLLNKGLSSENEVNEWIEFCKKNNIYFYINTKKPLLYEIVENLSLSDSDFVKLVGKQFCETYDYYRLVCNNFRHSGSTEKEKFAELTEQVKKYRDYFSKIFNVENAPNCYDEISYYDFKLFSNIIKHIARQLCQFAKPEIEIICINILNNDEYKKILKPIFKIYKNQSSNEKLKRKSINSLTQFLKTEFGTFDNPEIEKILEYMIKSDIVVEWLAR